ncbi:hypothetical protein LCGC14_0142280 [marine sediment metagenome]|uniref:Uncharacterized protein n=1 Tax=marine sediment metagenome TaxID=412755 RepID=A0A0F9Y2T9_9ZZZZ
MISPERRITKAYFMYACKKYVPLIHRIVYRVSRNRMNIENLKSHAKEELLRCMIRYDGRGAFTTFFYSRLFGVLRHVRDVEQRASRTQSVSENSTANIVSPIHDMDANMTVQEYLSFLTRDEHHVIIELFFNNKTIREISQNCGSVSSTICRTRDRAIGKMRQRHQMELEK